MDETQRKPQLRGLAAFGAIATLLLTGCAAGTPASPATSDGQAAQTATAAATAEATTATAAVDHLPGYAPGDFPPVPLFVLPDISLLTGSAGSFAIEARADLVDVPGVTVTAAQCDAGGSVIVGEGAAYLYGDGSGEYVGPDGVTKNLGDGSGTHVGNGVVIENNGDGSGSFVGEGVVITNEGNGAGSYVGDGIVVEIDGKGGGTFTGNGDVITNDGNGAGSFTGRGDVIHNNGDGSGSFTGRGFVIDNDGKGTATVNGVEVAADPLPPVPLLGSFPSVDALAPLESCGMLITFDSAVLFDFDQSTLRADATSTLTAVATVLDQIGAPQAIVSGHTDSIGSDAYNQELSEERARSVVADLESRGVTALLQAEGYGETRPVAPNEINGADNPAGRQLNRRVEIFIPTFS